MQPCWTEETYKKFLFQTLFSYHTSLMLTCNVSGLVQIKLNQPLLWHHFDHRKNKKYILFLIFPKERKIRVTVRHNGSEWDQFKTLKYCSVVRKCKCINHVSVKHCLLIICVSIFLYPVVLFLPWQINKKNIYINASINKPPLFFSRRKLFNI